MPTIKFTKKALKRLEVEERTEYFDVEHRFLGLRVEESGTKVFFARYRFQGKQRRDRIGLFPDLSIEDARKKAYDVSWSAKQGVDPRPKHSTGPTFKEVADQWLGAKSDLRRIAEAERGLNVDLLPFWEDRPAAEITRADVRTRLREIVERGAPVQANRTLTLIRRIYNWAVQEELVQLNPSAGLVKPHQERPAQRTLQNSEICTLWAVLEDEDSPMARLFQSLLILGQRSTEVRTARMSDVDGDWWTIPEMAVKSKREHAVFLPRLQHEVLAGVNRLGSDWWFPSSKKKGHPIQTLNVAYNRYSKLCGFKFTPHDLRRTFYTGLCSIGVDERIVERICGHSIPGVGPHHYNRWKFAPEKKAAMLKWERHLRQLITGDEPEKVVPIHG